jgi:hypothetical protein
MWRATPAVMRQAIAEGRRLAMHRKVEHMIRRLDGTIGERSTYGHHPRDI